MNQLLEIFRRVGKLSPKNEGDLLNATRRIELAPRTQLLDTNQVCSKIYFVEKGIARTFYYKDGKDITYWIAVENDFVGSMSSYFNQLPSNKLVETVEQCVLWEFEHSKLESLFTSSPEMGELGRLFSNYGISLMEKRFDNLHFYSAKERYEILLNSQPQIIQRVPLGMIASYLGIAQETLSRIRTGK